MLVLSLERISIHLMFLLIEVGNKISMVVMHFNTSHVSINRIGKTVVDGEKDFNTSHVSINRSNTADHAWTCYISIHLMFLLIGVIPDDNPKYVHFNTSHVFINRRLKAMENGQESAFQYISCFY